jgi:hypothetical protein
VTVFIRGKMEPALMEDLDRQIASVMDCNPLLEDEVVRLCEKVWHAAGVIQTGRALLLRACRIHTRRCACLSALRQEEACVCLGERARVADQGDLAR